MIYTITLNPALDLSGNVDQLIPNEKCYVHDEIRTPGGNGINAAIIAHRLGAKVIASGFLGGQNGALIKDLLQKQNIKNNFVKIKGHTRMNLTVSNLKSHLQTRLSFTGPKIETKELFLMKKFMSKITKRDVVVIGGSLPPGVRAEDVEKMVEQFRQREIFCMVDMPSISLKKILKAGPSFIKPNLYEFQQLTGKKVSTVDEVINLAFKKWPHMPLLCVSSVEGGAILKKGHEVWFGKLPKVKIKSTVGAGDSMVGAIAALLDKNSKASAHDLLQIGLAASCATLTEPGLVLGSKRAILKYKPLIQLQKLL